MVKKVIIFLFILPIFILGITGIMFVYSKQTQSFIISSFNLKSVINEKVQSFISKKINDKNIIVKIDSITFLKPNWPNIVNVKLDDINVYKIDQKEKSNIKFIEIGFSYENLFRNIFFNEDNFESSFLSFKDLTLNAKLEKNKFIPGPLFKIFSLINQKGFEKQQTLKKILQNKIIIGNINFLLSDERIAFKKSVLKINCKNVLISKYLNKTRSLNMNCDQDKKLQFSVKADLFENFNKFSGNIQNIDPKLIFSNWVEKNLKSKIKNVSSYLNGNFNIITDKNFYIKSLNFLSKKSNLILKNKNNVILDTNFSGEILWNKQDDLEKINSFTISNLIIPYAEVDFISKKGFSNIEIKKISTTALKSHLTSFESYYNSFINLNILKKYNDHFKGGSLKNINLDFKFSFMKKFNITRITGLSNFNKIRFEHNNKIFKKILCTISGNFKFELKTDNNKINYAKSRTEINLEASNGFSLFRGNSLEYKFDYAKIIAKIYNDKYSISEAKFFNNNLEHSFKNVEISQNTYKISKAMLFRNNKLQYIFKDTIIDNFVITNSSLIARNNKEFSDYLKKHLDVEVIGEVEFDFIVSGNIKNLDLNLKLNSDLTTSAFKINYLNLVKKKNIISSIKAEMIYQKGKLISFKDIMLKIEKNNYEANLIKLNYKTSKNILFKNIKTPKLDLKQILISKKDQNLYVYMLGQKIDFSTFKNNLQKQTNHNKNINFDITANKIILDQKISLAGNLKGLINKSFFDATAFGQMWLAKASLLDSGKFKIYLDDKISKLDGFGLVGGAETKISMKKKVNEFPQMIFDTTDGGKLLKALGFTKNIKSGEMKINIKFLNDKYDHYRGTIKSKKFNVVNTPSIINSLSILSFSGIQSVISGEGVYFDKGQANINVENKIFNFDNVYLSSQSLGIAAKGKINLESEILDMSGSIAPIKLISQIISVVPAVGELLTGLKKEGLFAGQFKMVGPIKKPKVKLNTLSFAPGILRDLFAEDWLNKKNFFLRNR